jgi:phosphomannomutase/phosphoglucomutase
MQVPPTVFREYDIRGLVGSELTPEFARALGSAFAAEVATRIGGGLAPTIAVGRDNRPSGAALASAIRGGIVTVGGVALDVGELPTPALYYAEHHLKANGCLQVTGSHNPPEFNGFKMVIRHEAVHGEQISALRDAMTSGSFPTLGEGVERPSPGVLDAYRRAIVDRHPLARPVKVVVDCGNGVASLIAVSTLEAMGAEVVPLFCDSDGTFPNHHPDPTVPENLRDLSQSVTDTGAEFGIAFDGDGDRIGAVNEHGRIIWGDQLLIVLGRDLTNRLGPGEPVIFDVKCSNLLPEALRAAGAVPVMWKTGHSLIKAKMKELNAKLAGEMSGHMFFGGDWFGFDDALFAAARLLQIVAAGPPGLARLLADLPETYTTPELRVMCPEERKFAIVEEAVAYFGARYEVNTIDGVRIAFPDGWGLLRASNTQPVLVLRFEATSEEALARYRREVFDWLAARDIQA